jgi:cytoskeletal protein RodZ
MKTIGQILKDARAGRNYSLDRVEEKTKIKKGFVDAIEKGSWDSLPPFPTVLGFVKSLASTLGVNEKMAVAVLKRDYPPKKLNINPKPDVSSKFAWSPSLTFLIGIICVGIVIFGYLIFQYIKFVSPPGLTVDSPKEGQEVTAGSVAVFGSTDSDSKITVNNSPVLVDENGKFSINVQVVSETKDVVVKATSRSGKTTTVSRKIEVK